MGRGDDPRVGREAAEGKLKGRPGDAALLRIRPQGGEEGIHARARRKRLADRVGAGGYDASDKRDQQGGEAEHGRRIAKFTDFYLLPVRGTREATRARKVGGVSPTR